MWPTATFRTELPETIRREIDQLCATIVGNLSPQHHGDGSHHDLTTNTLALEELFFQTLMQRIAEDRSTGDGGLRIDLKNTPNSRDNGRLRLFDAAGNPAVTLGAINVGTGLGAPRPAIQFQPFGLPGIITGPGGASNAEAWAIGTTQDAFDQGLALTDVTNANHVLVLYRTGPGNYALCRANNSLAALTDLGQPFAALRFDNVYAKKLHAQQQIIEKGRAVAMGEWQYFSPVLRSTSDPQPSGYDTVGRYTLIGQTCIAWINIGFNAGSTYGAGAWVVDVPVAASPTTPPGAVLGSAQLVNADLELRTGVVVYGGAHQFLTQADHVGNYSGPTVPFVWAPGDVYRFNATFEIA